MNQLVWGILGAAALLVAGLPTIVDAYAGEVLDHVLKSEILRMPNEPDWPPYSFINDQGEYTGFDVEVAREVARRIGVALQIVDKLDGSNYTWTEQTGGNWDGAYDVVIGSMTPTAKRDENLDFPVVYHYGMAVLAVHRDNASIKTPADASGKRIGVMKAANYEYYIRREPFGIVGMEPITYKIDNPVVITYDSQRGPFDALEAGDGVELDGFIEYLPTIMDLIEQGRPFKIVGQPLYRVPQSVAVEPGDAEFAALLKKTVEEMHQDGTLSALSMKWFGLDMTKR